MALLLLSFISGMLSFFSPCSFPLLPGYISYYLSRKGGEPTNKNHSTELPIKQMKEGITLGSFSTFGFLTVFLISGMIVSISGSIINRYFPYVSVFVGGVLILLGIFMFLEFQLSIDLPFQVKYPLDRSYVNFYIFGVGYSLTSLACLFPVFMMIVFSAIATGEFFHGLLLFTVYGIGMGSMMISISVSAALSREFILQYYRSFMPYVKKVSGGVLIVAGSFLIYNEWSIFT